MAAKACAKEISIDTLLDMKDNIGKDYKKIKRIEDELLELQEMIGNEELKRKIAEQIIMLIQNLHDTEMLNIALFGPPGTGKTTLAKIIGTIYAKLGHLSEGNVYIVGREDLIGQYLGETALKTTEVLENSLGNVLFIDEVYSLGNDDKRDSFAKECVDTITKFLSENPKDFLCIIAGYENEVRKYFFDQNPGLDRRFPFKFKLNQYNSNDLYKIFKHQIYRNKWKFRESEKDKEEMIELFKKHKDRFKNNGGDTENLLCCCKIAHSVRIFGQKKKQKKCIIMKDIKNGFAAYIENKAEKKDSTDFMSMYT